MPKLKTPEFPQDFIELNEEFIEIKEAYDEVRARYKEHVQEMSAQGWRAGHIHRISPLPYPTLRKWMDSEAPTSQGADADFLQSV